MTRHVILPLFFAAAFCFGGCRKKTPPAPMAPPPPAVTIQQPLRKEIVDWDEYPGRLEAVETVEVRARVEGYLQEIHFKDGAEVKKGDLLFVIDPRPYQATLDRAQADLLQAQTKFELASNEFARAERLLQTKAISEEEADTRNKARREAEAAIQSARAMVETTRLNLDYTRITSPITGRIGERMMTQGNLVRQGPDGSSLLARIVSLDPIYCYFDADEKAVLKYQGLGRKSQDGTTPNSGKAMVELELANEKGFPHKGVLDFLDNRVDPTTGTLRIRGVFANPAPDRRLQPGFFARVRVPGSEKYEATLVPALAIGTDQAQKFVYIVNAKDEVEYRKVELGPEHAGMRVIRNGLKTNDWVVVNGLMSARPGVKVSPKKIAPGTPATPAEGKGQ